MKETSANANQENEVRKYFLSEFSYISYGHCKIEK